jgi:glycogen operon protein
MRHLVARLSASAVLFLCLFFLLSAGVSAAIDASALGARYNGSNIDFKVFSSRATRIEVFIYKTPSGAQEVVRYVLTKNATTNVWSKSVAVPPCATATASPGRSITATVPGAPTGRMSAPGKRA